MVNCYTLVEGSIIFHIKTALIDPSDYKRRMRGKGGEKGEEKFKRKLWREWDGSGKK